MKKREKMDDLPKLLIVESPNKIKTISKFLGNDFKIMSTVGHIKDLPAKKLGVVIDDKDQHIHLEYVVMPDKKEVIDKICRQARQSSEIYLASDPDREGEIISWHIGEEIAKVFKHKDRIFRIRFNEITKPAIKEAIEHKSQIDMKKVEAQQARRVLDRWVGYEVSPILWVKVAKGLSAGRVQSIAVLFVCKREDEIKNFKSEESWSIHALFTHKQASLLADLVKVKDKAIKLKTKADADKVQQDIKQEKSFVVDNIVEKEAKKNPLPPFMTSTLQQDAFNKLGFSVDKTMRIAQRLYEGVPLADSDSPEALITYMRTDSLRIADSALKAARGFIGKEYGSDYVPSKERIYSKEGAQDAHEAIRPIDVHYIPSNIAKYLSKEEASLYDLIWKRFVACQMETARYFQRQVFIKGGDFLFKATGSTLIFDGFLKVYRIEDEEEEKTVKIPKSIEHGLSMMLKELEGKQHFTQPPPRYTEASLVKELEKQGVGRPSTYAAILSTIQKRKYIEKEKKRFYPTELGRAVNDLLVKHLPDIMDVSFTAKMEEDLDKIAHGQIERDMVLHAFYEGFQKELKKFGERKTGKTPVLTDKTCPECSKSLMIRFGKTGQFLGCTGFPECTFTSNFSRDEERNIVLTNPKEQIVSDIKCPQCGRGLVQKVGKFGPFLSCPGYPECKYIHQESLKTPCPQCGNKIVKRRWRGGTFWGCSGYPNCRFALFGNVIERACSSCKLPYMLEVSTKQGETSYVCSDKECGHKEAA